MKRLKDFQALQTVDVLNNLCTFFMKYDKTRFGVPLYTVMQKFVLIFLVYSVRTLYTLSPNKSLLSFSEMFGIFFS